MRRQRQRVYVLFLFLLVIGIGAAVIVVAQDLFVKANIFVLLPMYGIMLLSIMVIIGSRLLTTHHSLSDIPKDYVPIQEYHVPKNAHRSIHQGLIDSVNVEIEPSPSKLSHHGWGSKETETEHVHLKTFVAMSHQVVIKTITENYPQLERLPSQSMRLYLHSCAETLGIDAGLMEDYTNMYELARFGPDEIDVTEYQEFTTVLSQLLESIKLGRTEEVSP